MDPHWNGNEKKGYTWKVLDEIYQICILLSLLKSRNFSIVCPDVAISKMNFLQISFVNNVCQLYVDFYEMSSDFRCNSWTNIVEKKHGEPDLHSLLPNLVKIPEMSETEQIIH